MPAAPSNLAATAVSAGQIDLAWADNANNETGFKVERSAPGGTFVQVALVGANVTTYSDTGGAAPQREHPGSDPRAALAAAPERPLRALPRPVKLL